MLRARMTNWKENGCRIVDLVNFSEVARGGVNDRCPISWLVALGSDEADDWVSLLSVVSAIKLGLQDRGVRVARHDGCVGRSRSCGILILWHHRNRAMSKWRVRTVTKCLSRSLTRPETSRAQESGHVSWGQCSEIDTEFFGRAPQSKGN